MAQDLILFCACLALMAALSLAGGQLRRLRRELEAVRKGLVAERRESYYDRLVAEAAFDGLVVQSLDGTILWANDAYCRLLGRPLGEILGQNPLALVMPLDSMPTAAQIAAFRYDPQDPEYAHPHLRRNRRADGTEFWNQISVSFRTGPDGEWHAISVCRDATDQVEREERLRQTTAELEYSADHDGLTGIANRAALLRRTTLALAGARKKGAVVGMLHIDLDRFKETNDTHGHSAGDAVLMQVAKELRAISGPDDIVARIGGDEFAMVVPGIGSLDDLHSLAAALARSLAKPFHWRNRTLTCAASIGAAISEAEATPDDLLQRSDFALYEVKRGGRGTVATYDQGLHIRHGDQVRRAAELTAAVAQGGLTFHFQPTYSLRNARVSGIETLVRWHHATDGLQSPADFLPMAAELGLMAQIDFAAMDAALDLKRRLNLAGHDKVVVAINASEALLSHPDFVARLTHGVLARGIEPGQVVIEVLETIVFSDQHESNPHARIITDLRRAGYETFLDDFGMGHAGLAHLAQLDVSGVKIDRSLIRNIPDDATSTKIVATMIDLCADLNLKVVAEGVETHDVANHLWDMGCHVLQGFWYCRPLPADEVLEWVSARHPAPGIESGPRARGTPAQPGRPKARRLPAAPGPDQAVAVRRA